MGSQRQQAKAEAARERTVRERQMQKREEKRPAAIERNKTALPALTPTAVGAAVPPDVRLAVGDVVVYGNHGIGRVAARRKQEMLGRVQDVVVLELEQLTVTLPVTLARTQLRPVADEADLRRVGDALRADAALSSRNWLSRRKDTLEKLVGGTPVELAQIVSEGAQRERIRSASGGGKWQPASSERQLYAKARALLSSEIALALDIHHEEAESWIDGHLVRPGSFGIDGIVAR